MADFFNRIGQKQTSHFSPQARDYDRSPDCFSIVPRATLTASRTPYA